MAANQDTEITLNTGKLLGFFFGMVVICAVFFSLGFAMGKGSAPAQPAITDSAALSNIPSTGGSKPTAGRQEPAVDETTTTQTAALEEQPVSEDPVIKTSAPEMTNAPAGFMVQVAAVSKQEDADALVSALRKRQYPVFVVNNVANSKLYHVQVGPFSDQKEAETMRVKLSGDGYNAILKK